MGVPETPKPPRWGSRRGGGWGARSPRVPSPHGAGEGGDQVAWGGPAHDRARPGGPGGRRCPGRVGGGRRGPPPEPPPCPAGDARAPPRTAPLIRARPPGPGQAGQGHVALRGTGGTGLGAGLAGAGPPDAAHGDGQARVHHGLRQRLWQPAGPAAGPAWLPSAGRLPDPAGSREPAGGQRRGTPEDHPARCHPLRQHPPGRRVGAAGGGGERAVWASEQRGRGQPHRPHGVDGHRGLPPDHGRQRLRGHRGHPAAAAAAETGAGPSGQHVQRPGARLGQRRRLLRVQVLRRGLLGQPQAGHAALWGQGEHGGAGFFQDQRDGPGRAGGVAAALLGAPGARDPQQLRGALPAPVPEGAAPAAVSAVRPGPGQGHRLHRARAAGAAPAQPLQRRLGRQAALAAGLLPALGPRGPGPGPHPAQAGPQRPLRAPRPK